MHNILGKEKVYVVQNGMGRNVGRERWLVFFFRPAKANPSSLALKSLYPDLLFKGTNVGGRP